MIPNAPGGMWALCFNRWSGDPIDVIIEVSFGIRSLTRVHYQSRRRITGSGNTGWTALVYTDGSNTLDCVALMSRGTTYDFQVRALNYRWRPWRCEFRAITYVTPTSRPTLVLPASPTGFMGEFRPADVTIVYTWDTQDDADYWEIRCQVGSDPVGDWFRADTNAYTIPNLTRGVTYACELRAVNLSGESPTPYPTSSVEVPPPQTPEDCDSPDNVSGSVTADAFGGTSTFLNVNWTVVVGAFGYRVRSRRDPLEPDFSQWFDLPGALNNSFTITNPTSGQTYRYEIQTYCGTFAAGPYSGTAELAVVVT